MSDIKDIRTIEAVTDQPRTSLSAFMETINATDTTESSDDTTTDDTTDDNTDTGTNSDNVPVTVEDGETTETEPSEEADETEEIIEVKGKKVTKKDLINAYETREEISRRFGEIGTKEKRLEAREEKLRKEKEEIDFINEKFEEMREQVLEGNPLAAMQVALALGAKDGDTESKNTLEELIKQSIQIAENFHSMSEDEQKLFLKEEAIKQRERKIARQSAKQKALEEEQQLARYYTNLLDTHKMTDAELDIAFEDIQKQDKLREHLDKLDKKGKIDYCASWVLGKRLNRTIEEGIKKVDPKLASDNTFRLALLDVVDLNYTVDDIVAVVRQYKGESSNGSANGTSEASTQSAAPKKSATSNRAPTEKPKAEDKSQPILSWSDIIAKHS